MLSVIICTYNRDRYIYNVLKSISDNDFPLTEYEIVLVNNNSNDNTEKECRRFQADCSGVNFRYFVETQQGLSYARNKGITEAYGDVLIYVDDDATVNEEYLRTYADFFDTYEAVAAAGGAIMPVYETEPPRWMSRFTCQLMTGYLYCGEAVKKFKSGRFPTGGNVAFRRDVFEQVGVFNPELGRKGNNLMGAEEKDIFDKMTAAGMQFYYLPTAILYHIIPACRLTEDFFNRLSYGVGQSERMRTLAISKTKFAKRIMIELFKWGASVVLWLGYLLRGQYPKGQKIIAFRWNVTRGLLSW